MSFKEKMEGMAGVVVNQTREYFPEICIGSGIVLGVAAAVNACKATTKAAEIREEIENDKKLLQDIAKAVDEGDVPEDVVYSEEDRRKDRIITTINAGKKWVKLYGTSIAMGAVGIALILYGTKVLRGRNVALTAAYMALDKGFRDYRSRVVERFGEEVDNELRFNVKAEEIEQIKKLKNGEEKTVKKKIKTADPDLPEYSMLFSNSMYYIEEDEEGVHNLAFLRAREDEWNKILEIRSKHHKPVYLDEVARALGFSDAAIPDEWHVIGWDPDSPYLDDPNVNKKRPIDFGVQTYCFRANERYKSGYEPELLLDFNVTGLAYGGKSLGSKYIATV